MSKSIELRPSWKRWFWGYLLGILLIPAAGIGLAVLWYVHTSRQKFSYTVSDRQIRTVEKTISQTVDLANVKNLDVHQNFLDKKFNIGDVVLTTESRSVTLLGQSDPHTLSDMISRGIRAELKRIEEESNIEEQPEEESSAPGTLDKLDYLTGLWQQGLISDEDFEKERKHFEK